MSRVDVGVVVKRVGLRRHHQARCRAPEKPDVVFIGGLHFLSDVFVDVAFVVGLRRLLGLRHRRCRPHLLLLLHLEHLFLLVLQLFGRLRRSVHLVDRVERRVVDSVLKEKENIVIFLF